MVRLFTEHSADVNVADDDTTHLQAALRQRYYTAGCLARSLQVPKSPISRWSLLTRWTGTGRVVTLRRALSNRLSIRITSATPRW